MIYSNRHILSFKIKIMLCELMVLSHFSYCDFIYGPCLTQVDKLRIQKVQNSCCRLIYGIRKYDHISHKIKECGWINMEGRRNFHLSTFTHKLLTCSTSSTYLQNKFIPRTKVHTRNIRHKTTFTIPQHKTSIFHRSFI